MKRLIVLALAAAGAVAIKKQVDAKAAQKQPWQQATDQAGL